jgi:hypothetical protein
MVKYTFILWYTNNRVYLFNSEIMVIRTKDYLCWNCKNDALMLCSAINKANWKRDTYVCGKCKIINHDKFIFT